MQLLFILKSLTECADGSRQQALGSPAGLKERSAYKECGARLSGVCADRGGKDWGRGVGKTESDTHIHTTKITEKTY